MAEEVKKDEDWMQKKWRPAMGWMYMIICTLDMAVFPVLWSMIQVFTKQPVTQWNPLTLQGAGLFHLAMGAVLGIAAWGRTQEKVNGAASNAMPAAPAPVSQPAPSMPMPMTSQVSLSGTYAAQTPYVSAQPTTMPTSYAPFSPSMPAATVIVGYGGRPAPVQPDFPLL